MSAQIQIWRVESQSINWSFVDGAPLWVGRNGRFGYGREVFDPFPGYGHDFDAVDETCTVIRESLLAVGWQPPWPVDLYLFDLEFSSRTNGWSTVAHDGYDDETGRWRDHRGMIALSGKRTPIHPAMTRYLVAHEYGHNVEQMLLDRRDENTPDAILHEYVNMRGMTTVHRGSGGRWHDSPAEVFANDFRIVVCGVEPDFWPHHGIQHPLDLEQVSWWWEQTLESKNRVPPEKEAAIK